MTLLQKLLTADIVCRDCGDKYGSYSVGCSSTWQAECPVCGETKGCTEVRDWGYLTKGIKAEKAKIAGQSLEVANYMKCQEELANRDDAIAYLASVGPIMNDDELSQYMEESENKMTYKTTITGVCVHRVDADHRTLQTEVKLVDEGGGEYISLMDSEGQEIRLDFEEFEEVVKAVALLRAQ